MQPLEARENSPQLFTESNPASEYCSSEDEYIELDDHQSPESMQVENPESHEELDTTEISGVNSVTAIHSVQIAKVTYACLSEQIRLDLRPESNVHELYEKLVTREALVLDTISSKGQEEIRAPRKQLILQLEIALINRKDNRAMA